MSLMYCYAIIIFMVIVNSNSYENYRIIDTKFVNCEDNDSDDYLCYVIPSNGHPNYLNQKLMDPEDFYSAFFNPYFYFFHHSNIFDDNVISYQNFVEKRDQYLMIKYDSIGPSTITRYVYEEDLKYIGLYPKYWTKRPQFYAVNRKMAKYYYTLKLLLLYQSEKVDVEEKGEIIMEYLQDEDKYAPNSVDKNDVIFLKLWNKDVKRFAVDLDQNNYKINKTEYDVLLNLMAFLPKVDESVGDYLKRYFLAVYSMLYMSANFQIRLKNHIEKLKKDVMGYLVNNFNKLKVMSKDRVNNLKSPYLMRLESYNCYVMRMKNMKVLPFHIDFFKKKYDLFKDDIGSKTIFDEFEVIFKDTSQELRKEHGEQSSESGQEIQ